MQKDKIISENGRVTCSAIECIYNENPLCLVFVSPYPPQMINEGGHCSKYERKEFLRPKEGKQFWEHGEI